MSVDNRWVAIKKINEIVLIVDFLWETKIVENVDRKGKGFTFITHKKKAQF